MTRFTVITSVALNQKRDMPNLFAVLNRHSDFEKGVNQILKLVCSRTDMDATQLAAFVAKTFSGLLSHRNIISLAKFLAKQHKRSAG